MTKVSNRMLWIGAAAVAVAGVVLVVVFRFVR